MMLMAFVVMLVMVLVTRVLMLVMVLIFMVMMMVFMCAHMFVCVFFSMLVLMLIGIGQCRRNRFVAHRLCLLSADCVEDFRCYLAVRADALQACMIVVALDGFFGASERVSVDLIDLVDEYQVGGIELTSNEHVHGFLQNLPALGVDETGWDGDAGTPRYSRDVTGSATPGRLKHPYR